MKPKKQVIKAPIPAKIDIELIKRSKQIAQLAGFRFYNSFVEAAVENAIRVLENTIKKE